MKTAIKQLCLALLCTTILVGCSLYDDMETEVIECPKAGTPIDPEPWQPGSRNPKIPK